MTVSRALRNHSEISKAQRDRILNIAEKHGYRPDPEVRKLMHHIRNQRRTNLQGGICVLISKAWLKTPENYCRRLLDGARKRATELGFSWQVYTMEDLLKRPRQFQRTMIQRGIDGILCPPLARPCSIPEGIRWENFSVVAATHSLINPVFHRVVPNHFLNMISICDQLRLRNYKRIGLAVIEQDEERTRYQFSSAISGICQRHKLDYISPFLLKEAADLQSPKIKKWFELKHPDAIILNGDSTASLLSKFLKLKRPGPVAIVSTDCHSQECAGINQLPESVGSIAVELLSSMIVHNEKGVPSHPRVVMADGEWQDGILQPIETNLPPLR